MFAGRAWDSLIERLLLLFLFLLISFIIHLRKLELPQTSVELLVSRKEDFNTKKNRKQVKAKIRSPSSEVYEV
jgi:hypothetical protein